MRRCGVLLPIFSLHSTYGIGTIGKAACEFIDLLEKGGQKIWQILPISPVGESNSPYMAYSVFAGNHMLIDLDLLIEDDLLTYETVNGDGSRWGDDPMRINYGYINERKFALLKQAAKTFAEKISEAPETDVKANSDSYEAFLSRNSFWLDDYALFMSVKESLGGTTSDTWAPELRTPDAQMVEKLTSELHAEIKIWKTIQYFFFDQWAKMKAYAQAHDVRLLGDLSFYVSEDSSDFWLKRHLFLTDQDGSLSVVAGVPPDGFSADGQKWNMPIYDWAVHKKNDYRWWLARIQQCDALYDMVRIDHFRGLSAYYSIPFDKPALDGEWKIGPGNEFIDLIKAKVPNLEIIAEDLGVLDDGVYNLLAHSGYPGMKIMQFAFDIHPDGGDNVYYPHNHVKNSVVYTGTHDNTTLKGWVETAPDYFLDIARYYYGLQNIADWSYMKKILREVIFCSALASVADTAIIPIQDWLEQGDEARINAPSTIGDYNWSYRMKPEQLTQDLADKMLGYTRRFRRI
ncbi:MAG: 4-alpha-glucanotransferase [Clostridiales Family XIII bacterium]|jgi:4-alpha-glucanotransferase|nr:4-alpha-glucanotransferase [Clostridiales Family XIII bacterium]